MCVILYKKTLLLHLSFICLGFLSDVCFCAGGSHAGHRSPQPDDQPHSPTHFASPGCQEWTPQHGADPAGGRHGRQLCGEEAFHTFYCKPGVSDSGAVRATDGFRVESG